MVEKLRNELKLQSVERMNREEIQRTWQQKGLGAICVSVLCAILAAALWPFNPYPKNLVTWLHHENGISFGGRGVVLSSGTFELPGPEGITSASLELWLEPAADNDSTNVLAFSSPESPEQFRLRQSFDSWLFLHQILDRDHRSRTAGLWIEHAGHAKKQRFITITSGPQGTTVYLDGVAVKTSPSFRLASKDLSGQLVLGSSPVRYDTWLGKLRGLALFHHELTASQVAGHCQAWTDGQFEAIRHDHPVALFPFNERAGKIVHNEVTSGPHLDIPESYDVPYKPFLKVPWKEFYPNRAYLQDVLINIVGFIPFGFFFCAARARGRPAWKAVIVTIVLGATVSLAIEILQAYLPTRNSGMTDLFTNTLGTGIGAMLDGRKALRALLAECGLQKSS